MKLACYTHDGHTRIGIVVGLQGIDLVHVEIQPLSHIGNRVEEEPVLTP